MPDQFDYILGHLQKGHYLVTLHAQKRMAERKISHADIRNCGINGKVLVSDDKFKVTGFDCNHELLTIICAVENEIIIITVF